ncbi:hypothetical protein PS1_047369 [Malus domestica]
MAFHEQFYRVEPEMTINDLVEFNELQELVIPSTKYEKLLTEEQQVKHSSKVPHLYRNKAPIHQLEFEGLEPGENDSSLGEGIELCAAEMTIPFKPLMVKGLV